MPAADLPKGVDPRARLNAWIELQAAAYGHNLHFFRRLVGPTVELAAVVKANAYGHGLCQIAALAVKHGADSFAVHSPDEALRLRQGGFAQDILIMGHVPLLRLDEVVAQEFRLVLFHLETAQALAHLCAAQQKSVRVHLKLETGTYRQGVAEDELDPLLDWLTTHPALRLEGAYTHFANIEDTTNHDYAGQQLARFERLLARIRASPAAQRTGFKRHAACSAATLLFPHTHFDMVRLGISQYGLWPSKETLLSYRLLHPRDARPGEGRPGESRTAEDHPSESGHALRPVLSWKARISQLKRVPAGSSIGYGCTYQTTRATHLAILPVGYADGYDRRLSNQAHVLVRGQRAPVRGRICMNLTMVDVTDIPGVELEDEVVLIGRQGSQEITAEHLAAWVGTINYEIVSRISPDLPRLVV